MSESPGEIQRHRRREALAAAREELGRDPVDPGLWAQLREIIQDEEALAVWMTASSGWLRGARPLDVWRDDPAAVLEAARRWVEPLDF